MLLEYDAIPRWLGVLSLFTVDLNLDKTVEIELVSTFVVEPAYKFNNKINRVYSQCDSFRLTYFSSKNRTDAKFRESIFPAILEMSNCD